MGGRPFSEQEARAWLANRKRGAMPTGQLLAEMREDMRQLRVGNWLWSRPANAKVATHG